MAWTSDPRHDQTDRYARLLAFVRTDSEVNRQMVASGWATVYVYADMLFGPLAAYQAAATTTERAKRGVWRACCGDFHRVA